MIKQEFRKWVEDIKILYEKRVKNFASIHVEDVERDTISLTIIFSEGQMFCIYFDQKEFNFNNKRQRRSLSKARRKDLAWQIGDSAKTLTKTAKALNR